MSHLISHDNWEENTQSELVLCVMQGQGDADGDKQGEQGHLRDT